MQARDIMTSDVATVASDTPVAEIARRMLQRHVSAVPVVGDGGKVVGIVSEGDLIRRLKSDDAAYGSWWLDLLASPEERAESFIHAHGQTAGDVMSTDVVTVEETATVPEIAALLESKRIKRVPVLRSGKLVGLVSRADLLRGVAVAADTAPEKPGPGCDRVLRERIQDRLASAGVAPSGLVHVVVRNGVVHLWGATANENQRKAVRIAAEEIAGPGKVEDHLGTLPASALYGY